MRVRVGREDLQIKMGFKQRRREFIFSEFYI
jgi:hypothetical protein